MIYEEVNDKCILRFNEDESVSSIPVNEANSDYQAYLAWKAEQSTPKAGK